MLRNHEYTYQQDLAACQTGEMVASTKWEGSHLIILTDMRWRPGILAGAGEGLLIDLLVMHEDLCRRALTSGVHTHRHEMAARQIGEVPGRAC